VAAPESEDVAVAIATLDGHLDAPLAAVEDATT
jgi:hypothetical protein